MRFYVVALLALYVVFAAAAAQEYTVKYASVVHNYGAITPLVNSNQAELCGPRGAQSCGQLVTNGRAMVRALGTYVRSRYTNTSVVGNAPLLTSTEYNQFEIESFTQSVARSQQSAYLFMAGVYPGSDVMLVSTQPSTVQAQLTMSTNELPPVMIRRSVDVAGTEAALQPQLAQLVSLDQLQAAAAEVSSTEACSSSSAQVTCALRLYEIAHSRSATDGLAATPNLQSINSQLFSFQAIWAAYVYGYDAANEQQQAQGSSGQMIASAVLEKLTAAAAGSAEYPLSEYSVDAGVVTPLSVTLGDQSTSAMTAEYAEAMMVELLQRSTDGSHHVRVVRGAPAAGATSGSYTFTTKSFQLYCLASGATAPYAATGNTCPLADFQRYVQSRSQVASQGYCNIDAEDQALLQCPTRPSQAVTGYCRTYRTVCPTSSCPDGFVLEASTLRCVREGSSATGVYRVVLPQVVHRHGARSPNMDFNQSFICGYEYPCGMLTNIGMQQLVTVGSFLRERYNNASMMDTPLSPTGIYNASEIYTRSTSMARTLQSASALLSGLFPNGSFYPAIFTVNFTLDTTVSTDSLPPVMVKRFVYDAGRYAYMNPVCDRFMSWDAMRAAAVEAHIGGASGPCADFDKRADCAEDLFDIGISFQVSGRLGDKPVLAASIQNLTDINEEYYRYVFGYNASVELDREQGTVGQNLAQALISNMEAHMVAPSYRMYQYSTHDVVVAPLGVALGDDSSLTMVSAYGTTYIVELLQDNGDDSYHVRVLRGRPSLDTNGTYYFEQYNFTQHCITSAGVKYVAANNVCPLEDFIRLVDSTAPSVPKGLCTLSDAQYASMGCPATVGDDTPVPHYCEIYRLVCPAYSCPANYVLSAVDFQCYPLLGSETVPPTTTTTTTMAPTQAPQPTEDPNAAAAARRQSEQARAERNRRAAVGIVNGVNTGLAVGAAVSLL